MFELNYKGDEKKNEWKVNFGDKRGKKVRIMKQVDIISWGEKDIKKTTKTEYGVIWKEDKWEKEKEDLYKNSWGRKTYRGVVCVYFYSS